MPATSEEVGLRAVQRGHSPNCSSAGSVVGVALTSVILAAAVLSTWADRFLAWRDRGGGGGDAPEPPGPAPKLRREEDGALLAWPEPAALLHLNTEAADQAEAAGAEVVGGRAAPAGALSAPTEVHVAVTGRCPVRCTDCYLDAGPDGPEPDLEALERELAELAHMGVFEVALGGGEGLLRPGLLPLAARARAMGLVPNLTTSGFGVDPETAPSLVSLFGQVNISIDGLGPIYEAVRGWDGSRRGLAAARALVEAGGRVGVNTVISRPLLETPGALEALGEALGEAGVHEWQWLRMKPGGRADDAWARLSPDPTSLDELWPRALELEARTGLALRFDCALVPFLVHHGLPPERLAALGVHGCPGGERLWARGVDGRWAPCSFVPGDAASGSRSEGWDADSTLVAWRARAADPPEPCASCPAQTACRGGCRAVAAFLVGDALAPDPQCPRVRAMA